MQKPPKPAPSASNVQDIVSYRGSGEPVRCPRCGNENPGDNRFCGMCGAPLLASTPSTNKPQAVEVATPSTRPDAAPTRVPDEISRRSRVPAPEGSPSISGPSFLGLNDNAPRRGAPSRRASISIDPESGPPASNLHYLLEDEEDHKGSGLWKFILIVIALGLAVGFGYLRWKNQGLAWLNTPAKKPAITDEQPATAENPPPSPPSTTATSSAVNPSTSPSITPEAQPAVQQPVGAAPADGAVPTGSSNTPNAPATAPTVETNAAKPAGGANTDTPSNKASGPGDNSSEKSAAESAIGNDGANQGDDAPAPAKPKVEPAPKPRPSIPTDPVSEARKYLYGKGAAQDCERGLRLLRPAANSGNPKAMVEMGALYSAGLCTPRDLPTSYRWFAVALRKEPDNQSVQADLQKLWGEMTQPERQLAIKLTQ